MDFSILYRFVWNPTGVFKLFRGKLRLEPYIFVAAMAIFQGLKPYVGHFDDIPKAPFAPLMNLLVGFLLFLLFPIVNVIVVTLTTTYLGSERPAFLSILSAFILCQLP